MYILEIKKIYFDISRFHRTYSLLVYSHCVCSHIRRFSTQSHKGQNHVRYDLRPPSLDVVRAN